MGKPSPVQGQAAGLLAVFASPKEVRGHPGAGEGGEGVVVPTVVLYHTELVIPSVEYSITDERLILTFQSTNGWHAVGRRYLVGCFFLGGGRGGLYMRRKAVVVCF